MAVSVRLEPLLEKELELAAKRQGVTKSQFIISALEKALGRREPYKLMMELKAEESRAEYKDVTEAFRGQEQPYDTDASRDSLIQRLREKHGLSAD